VVDGYEGIMTSGLPVFTELAVLVRLGVVDLAA
jgi:hypothetical protein